MLWMIAPGSVPKEDRSEEERQNIDFLKKGGIERKMTSEAEKHRKTISMKR